jgi:hypothetical protein
MNKPDLYTKVILTVIAAALVLLVLQNAQLIPTAYADKPVAATPHFSTLPVKADGSIDVNIKAISPNQNLDVNIDRVGGLMVNSGVMDVNVRNAREFRE